MGVVPRVARDLAVGERPRTWPSNRRRRSMECGRPLLQGSPASRICRDAIASRVGTATEHRDVDVGTIRRYRSRVSAPNGRKQLWGATRLGYPRDARELSSQVGSRGCRAFPRDPRSRSHAHVARGDHTLVPLPFAPTSRTGISERRIVSHHDNNYGGAVKNLNRVEQELRRMDKDTRRSSWRPCTTRKSKNLHEASRLTRALSACIREMYRGPPPSHLDFPRHESRTRVHAIW